jgi:ATP-dependent Clp protease ATP-binding subunit ClpA
MTRDRAAKRAVRARMAATGEKYTEARRAAGASEPPSVPPLAVAAVGFDFDPIGAFTDQGYNAILLAEDEARMLGRPLVEPEHLLLAAARYGNVQRLLTRPGVTAGAIHAAIVARGGRGDDLILGRVPRSAASDRALLEATSEAFERGSGAPSTEHLLLGVARSDTVAVVLGELGLADPLALVNAEYPRRRRSLDAGQITERIAVAGRRDAPRPGPMPPVFERFGAESRAAVDDAIEAARSFESAYVTVEHLLVGLLEVRRGAVAALGAKHAAKLDALAAHAAAGLEPPTTFHSIFSASARQVVAEGVLAVAHRLGSWEIAAGHLLLAVLESPEPAMTRLQATVPGAMSMTTALADALAPRPQS